MLKVSNLINNIRILGSSKEKKSVPAKAESKPVAKAEQKESQVLNKDEVLNDEILENSNSLNSNPLNSQEASQLFLNEILKGDSNLEDSLKIIEKFISKELLHKILSQKEMIQDLIKKIQVMMTTQGGDLESETTLKFLEEGHNLKNIRTVILIIIELGLETKSIDPEQLIQIAESTFENAKQNSEQSVLLLKIIDNHFFELIISTIKKYKSSN